MDFQCLGPLEARIDGIPVDLGEPQRRLVLALLLVNANSVVSTDRLEDGIWGDERPESGRKIVQGYVSGLRKTLGDGDIIESRSPGYRLNVKPEQVDALVFEDRAAEGASGITSDPQHAQQVLREALSLWSGRAYEDLADHAVLQPEITRLEQLHAAAVEARVEADIFAGRQSGVTAELTDLTGRFPLRERLWSLRLLALYRSGRPTEALRAFDDAQKRLATEAGLEPSTELQLVRDRILQQDPLLLTSAALDASAESHRSPQRNPYKGLRPFDEEDAQDFYGRDDLVRHMHGALARRNVPRLVVLTGASGTGKSSVVRAGLIPRLRQDDWHIASMYPGSTPVAEFRAATTEVADANRAVIVVDQLEEAFTLVSDSALSAEFLNAVAEAVDPSTQGPWVVATVRADFLDYPMGHRVFAEFLAQALVIVTPLADHEVRDVITEPASRVRIGVEPDLVAAMVQQVGDRPTTLPLLQFALTDLFDRAVGGQLTLDAYRAGGGIAGALIERVEAVYAGFDEPQRKTTKQLMLRLVAVREGSEPVRRRVSVASLAGLAGLDRVLDKFGEYRLITFDRNTDGEPTVEVAHEALLREWPRLRSWIDEAALALHRQAQLAEAAEEWTAAGRSDFYLLTGARLARLSEWKNTGIALTGPEVDFLEASIDHEEGMRARRRLRRRWVMAGFGTAALLSAVLAGLALQSARVADQRAIEARAESLASSARDVLDQDPELSLLLAIGALELDPDSSAASGALGSALQAHRTVFAVDRGESPPATGAISPDGKHLAVIGGFQALEVFEVGQTDTPIWSKLAADGHVIGAALFTNDGRLLVAEESTITMTTETWTLYEPATGHVEHEQPIGEPCVSPVLWGTSNTSNGFADLAHPVFMVQRSVQPDGGCDTESLPQLIAFDVLSGSVEKLTEFDPGLIGAPTISDDGTRYAVASGGVGGVHEFGSVEPIRPLPPGMSTLSADGTHVLAGNDPLTLVDVDAGTPVRTFPGEYSRAHFSESGRFVVAAAFDGSTRVFDAGNGEELFELRAGGSRDLAVQMTLDERHVATFDGDGTARVWDVGAQLIGTASPDVFVPTGADAFLPRAAIVLASRYVVMPIGRDGSRETALFELDTGNLIETLPGRAVAISPDGATLVMQSWPGSAELEVEDGGTATFNQVGGLVVVDVATGEVAGELQEGPCLWYNRSDRQLAGPDCGDDPRPWIEWPASGSFSPDGSLFALGGFSGYVAVWNVASGERVHFIDSLAGGSQTHSEFAGWALVRFAPSGDHLAVHQFEQSQSKYVLSKWNTGAWQLEAEIELQQPLTEMEYTPDGSQLLAVDSATDVVVFDVESWAEVDRLEGQQGGQLHDLDVSPDGKLVAAGSENGRLWVWDLDDRSVFHRMEFPATAAPEGFDGLVNVEFVDTQTVLVSTEFSTVLMTLDPDTQLEFATSRLTRTFTDQECATYDIDPCPTLEGLRNR